MTLLLIYHRLAEYAAVGGNTKRQTPNRGMASLPFWSHIQRDRDRGLSVGDQGREQSLSIWRRRSRQQAGRLNHPRDRPSPADRHDVNAAHTLDRQELLRQLAGDS